MGRMARLKRARDKDVLPIVRFFELQIFELHLLRIRRVWCSLLSEDGMLPQCESGGLRQIDADIIGSGSTPVVAIDRTHQRVAQINFGSGANVRESRRVSKFMDGPFDCHVIQFFGGQFRISRNQFISLTARH